MALLHSTQTPLSGTRIAARLNGAFLNWRLSLSTWQKIRATRKALNRLSERELDDIGLCRADIDRVSAQ